MYIFLLYLWIKEKCAHLWSNHDIYHFECRFCGWIKNNAYKFGICIEKMAKELWSFYVPLNISFWIYTELQMMSKLLYNSRIHTHSHSKSVNLLLQFCFTCGTHPLRVPADSLYSWCLCIFYLLCFGLHRHFISVHLFLCRSDDFNLIKQVCENRSGFHCRREKSVKRVN